MNKRSGYALLFLLITFATLVKAQDTPPEPVKHSASYHTITITDSADIPDEHVREKLPRTNRCR